MNLSAEIAQDILAMRRARNWKAVDSVHRAMVGLGRWTPEAQAAYAEACSRFGASA